MPQFDVTKNEWEIAHHYLDNEPDGTKLPFTMEINQSGEMVSRMRFTENNRPYQTLHSFIKMDGKIIAFQRGRLGEGSMNKAKYAIDEKGGLYVVKMGDRERKLEESELAILSNLHLSKGALKRLDKQKQYVFMQALGVSLRQLLTINAQPKSLEERLDMAIQLCFKLYRLHEGHDSLTHTPHAHLDIKPDNITMTDDGKLHFIDFGLAEKYPKQPGKPKTGAYLYVAYCDATKNQTLTKEQYDVIALKRVIHMPDSLYCERGRFIPDIHRQGIEHLSLLSQHELEQFQLNDYINTFAALDEHPDYTNDNTSGVMLCAMLINAKYHLKIDNQKIAQDPILMHALTGFYIYEQKRPFSEWYSNPAAMKLMAALNALDRHNHYEAFYEDVTLMKALEHVSTFEEAQALVGLKQIGLEAHYEAVMQPNECVAEAILMFIRDELDVLTVINDHSKHIAKALLFLKRHFLYDNVKDVIRDPAVANALVCMVSQECEDSVIFMLKSKEFTPDEIIRVSQNPRLANASKWAWSNSFMNRPRSIHLIKLMAAHDSLLDAYINMQGIESLNDLERAIILQDPNKSQAVNFLFLSKNISETILKHVIHAEDMVKVFAWLQQRKMEALYLRALEDRQFSMQLSSILDKRFSDEITLEMLVNENIRECILNFYNANEKFQGLKILMEHRLIDQMSSQELNTVDFETVCFLQENQLSSFIKWMIECPKTGYSFRGLFDLDNQSSKAYHLLSILEKLPSEKRLEFIAALVNRIDIKSLNGDLRYWQEIKRLFSRDQKQAFFRIIYSQNELDEKQTLKNIKLTIKQTTWSYGYFDNQTHAYLGKTRVSVPSSVKPQVEVLSNVSSGRLTFSEGVSEIKRLGQQQLKARENKLTSYKHSIFGKSETAKYLELFATDERFDKAFVKKR